MAAKARSRSRKQARKPTSKQRGVGTRIYSLFRGLLTTIILIGAGILIGSFWGEWRVVRLGEEPARDPGPLPFLERIKVEVLNGSGEAGLAQAIGSRLRQLGFDVVAVDNADSFDHETTFVLDRSGRPGAAAEVAEGMGTDSVVVEMEPELFLDATVVVGRDWAVIAGRD